MLRDVDVRERASDVTRESLKKGPTFAIISFHVKVK